MPHTPQAIDCSQLEDGEVVVQCEMLSVDAFLRTMLDEEAYHGAIKLGDTLPALGYGRVIASANPKNPPLCSTLTALLNTCLL